MSEKSLQRGGNNFDCLRLLAASMVVIGHSYWLTGQPEREPIRRFSGGYDMADVAVHVFFVMSGYLIAASWLHSRSLIEFVGKRALRIFPALLVSTLFALLVVGPLATELPLRDYLRHELTTGYLANMLLITRFHLPGVFAANPFPDTVNGSLWTLPFEVGMYATLLTLGLFGLLRRRVVLPLLGLLFVVHFLAIDRLGLTSEVLFKFTRLGLFFLAGAALYLYRAQVPWTWKLALPLLVLSLVTGGSALWNPVQVLTLPYLTLYLAQRPLPVLSNIGRHGDFSYGLYIFSFPTQQLIVHWTQGQIGLGSMIAVSLLASLALAWLSWHLVEAPALALKRYLPRPPSAPLPAGSDRAVQ